MKILVINGISARRGGGQTNLISINGYNRLIINK
jgi:hypothetical protein